MAEIDVFRLGKKIRNSKSYATDGINVNFVERTTRGITVRTYERGVEDETFSCGTGVVASTLATMIDKELKGKKLSIKTLGGLLQVTFDKRDNGFENIWLIGPATYVNSGEINIPV